MRLQTAVLIACVIIGRVARAQSSPPTEPLAYDPASDFLAFNPNYREQKRLAEVEYERVKQRVADQQKNGSKATCARHLLQEAKCYVHCTAKMDRAQPNLAQLSQSLDAAKDPHQRGQVASDGGYACCTDEWFLKLDYTID